MATRLGPNLCSQDRTRSIVDNNPETTQGAPERPVADKDVDRVQRHWNDADDEVRDRLIDDENDEVGVEFLLVSVGEQNEEV